MKVHRRHVLKVGAAAGAGLVAGCDASPGWNRLARQFESVPETVVVPHETEHDLAAHALNRLAYGWRPGDLDRVRTLGVDEYIDEQLAPESIDDTVCDLRARRFESIHASAGDIFEYRKGVVERELFRHTLLRAVYSRRQLFESMVNFWTDHFNISIGKGECAWFKTVDDREVIRAHTLGNFRDLLRASALSPAMLVYLDGKDNKKAEGEEGANENYARELLELHTLGVHGGYTQQDVMEAARCLTGWTINDAWWRGRVEFREGQHDEGAKRVLGAEIPAGQGKKDLDRLLEIVVEHPATARYLATKLCRRFVADEPSPELIEQAASSFRDSNYEIKPMLRTLFASDEFRNARVTRLKRPFRFIASALRAVDADTDGGERIHEWLQRMGNAPFNYPTPDGYPDEPLPWLGTLLWRWNFALKLTSNGIEGTQIDLRRLARRFSASDQFDDLTGNVASYLLGRRPADVELSALDEVLREVSDEGKRPTAAALVLASPAFQRY